MWPESALRSTVTPIMISGQLQCSLSLIPRPQVPTFFSKFHVINMERAFPTHKARYPVGGKKEIKIIHPLVGKLQGSGCKLRLEGTAPTCTTIITIGSLQLLANIIIIQVNQSSCREIQLILGRLLCTIIQCKTCIHGMCMCTMIDKEGRVLNQQHCVRVMSQAVSGQILGLRTFSKTTPSNSYQAETSVVKLYMYQSYECAVMPCVCVSSLLEVDIEQRGVAYSYMLGMALYGENVETPESTSSLDPPTYDHIHPWQGLLSVVQVNPSYSSSRTLWPTDNNSACTCHTSSCTENQHS